MVAGNLTRVPPKANTIVLTLLAIKAFKEKVRLTEEEVMRRQVAMANRNQAGARDDDRMGDQDQSPQWVNPNVIRHEPEPGVE